MKRTLITVSALLLASYTKAYDPIADADISDMVLNEQLLDEEHMHLRQLGAPVSKKPAADVKAEQKKKAAEKKQAAADGDEEDAGDAPDESSMAGDEEENLEASQNDQLDPDMQTEEKEVDEEKLEADNDKANAAEEKKFNAKSLDTTDDFTEDQFKIVAKVKGPKYVQKIKKFAAVMELLEPRARQFINVPQARNPSKRKNCGVGSDTKTHYLTTQGSKNFIQWKTKRVAKDGNCTIKISNDGKQFFPVTPVGMKNNFFPCGRKTGYEAVLVRFPKQMVSSDKGADFIILQFEMYSYMGTIVQCADMLVEKVSSFKSEKCDPQCKNGGVCQGGKCKCGSMYSGEFCENKVGKGGLVTILIFLIVLGLVAAACGLLYVKYDQEKKKKAEEVAEGGQREAKGSKKGYGVMDESIE